MLSQNELEVIKFIEDEYQLNELIESMVDTHTVEEINTLTESMFIDIAVDIAETLQVSKQEGIAIYSTYIDMMEKVAMLLVMKED